MHILKNIFKAICVLAVIAGLNCLLCYALIPYGSASEVAWSDFRSADEVDTIALGSSLMARGYDPTVVDLRTGNNSCNLSTPAQLPEESFMGLQEALEERPIKTVYFGFEINMVLDDKAPDPGRAFIINKDAGDPVAYAKDMLICYGNPRCLASQESINGLFPWIGNHVQSPEACIENVRMRLDGTSVHDAVEEQDPDWHYHGKGSGGYDGALDFDKGWSRTYANGHKPGEVNPEKLKAIADMAAYCEERGVDFVVVGVPLPLMDILEYGDAYFQKTDEVRQAVEAAGGSYCDFNLAKPQLFENEHSLYYDYQHMNRHGGNRFSTSLAEFLNMRAEGEDTTSLFYTQDEWQEAQKDVDFVKLDASVANRSATIVARAFCGPRVRPEYRFWIQNPDTGEWELVQDWSSNNTCTYDPPAKQLDVTVRVDARPQGSKVEYQHYRIETVSVDSGE